MPTYEGKWVRQVKEGVSGEPRSKNRTCRECGENKLIDEFPKNLWFSERGHYGGTCKTCKPYKGW